MNTSTVIIATAESMCVLLDGATVCLQHMDHMLLLLLLLLQVSATSVMR